MSAPPYAKDIETVDPEQPDRDRLVLGDFVEPKREPAVAPDRAELKATEVAVAPLFDAGDRQHLT